MIKILIFGTGSLYNDMKKYLDLDKLEIVNFIDNNKEKVGSFLDGIKVVSIKEIRNLKFDYILIASSFDIDIKKDLLNLGINEELIVSIYEFITEYSKLLNEYSWQEYSFNELESSIESVKKNENKYEFAVTGISYAKYGINGKLLNKNVLNLALPSQDLYYDYKIMKHILECFKAKMKYCVIGLSYYSFNYDLAKTFRGERCVNIYCKIIRDNHNYKKHQENNKINIGKLKLFFKNDFISMVKSFKWRYKKISFEELWNKSLLEIPLNEREQIGREIAVLHSNKKYNNTVDLNIKILNSYLEMLNNNNIQPILVVFPMTKYYRKFFEYEMKQEFYRIIQNLRYDSYLFYDFFDLELDERYFCDVFHLSKLGATKFTSILSEKIRNDLTHNDNR